MLRTLPNYKVWNYLACTDTEPAFAPGRARGQIIFTPFDAGSRRHQPLRLNSESHYLTVLLGSPKISDRLEFGGLLVGMSSGRVPPITKVAILHAAVPGQRVGSILSIAEMHA